MLAYLLDNNFCVPRGTYSAPKSFVGALILLFTVMGALEGVLAINLKNKTHPTITPPSFGTDVNEYPETEGCN